MLRSGGACWRLVTDLADARAAAQINAATAAAYGTN